MVRWVLLTGLLAASAFANGRGRFFAGANFGPASAQVGLGPAWTGINTSGRPVPLVPITNYTAGYGAFPGYGYYPYAYWYPMQVVQQPQPPPQPQQVIIEREVIIERPAPEPAPPPPPPQVIVIEHPAPVAQAPAPPPPPPEPPKPPAPRTPGPDVYSWTDADGVVHYSTRAPAAGVKAKKLATLAK